MEFISTHTLFIGHTFFSWYELSLVSYHSTCLILYLNGIVIRWCYNRAPLLLWSRGYFRVMLVLISLNIFKAYQYYFSGMELLINICVLSGTSKCNQHTDVMLPLCCGAFPLFLFCIIGFRWSYLLLVLWYRLLTDFI